MRYYPISKLTSPEGSEIIGTKEELTGVARLAGVHASPEINGGQHARLTLEYAGETEIAWDDQHTMTDRGERVFVDENHLEWLESQLNLDGDPVAALPLPALCRDCQTPLTIDRGLWICGRCGSSWPLAAHAPAHAPNGSRKPRHVEDDAEAKLAKTLAVIAHLLSALDAFAFSFEDIRAHSGEVAALAHFKHAQEVAARIVDEARAL